MKLQLVSEDEANKEPVASDRHDVVTLTVAACDGDAAVSAARDSVRQDAECIRLLSVKMMSRIDLWAEALASSTGSAEREQAKRESSCRYQPAAS